MPRFGKLALVALMTTAMAVPAYAAGGGGSTSASGGSTGANAGTGSSSTSRPSNTGVNTNTSSRTSTSPALPTVSGSAVGTNTTTSGSSTSGTAGVTARNPAITDSARSNAANPAYSGSGNDTRGDSMTQYSREGFIGSDRDRSSSLNLDEYSSYLGNTGSRAQIQSQFNTIDTNRDGFLSEIELQASGSASTGTQLR